MNPTTLNPKRGVPKPTHFSEPGDPRLRDLFHHGGRCSPQGTQRPGSNPCFPTTNPVTSLLWVSASCCRAALRSYLPGRLWGLKVKAVPGTEEMLLGKLAPFILIQGLKAFPAVSIICSPWRGQPLHTARVTQALRV